MAVLIASAALTAVAVQAQVSTEPLYLVKFKATATPGNDANGEAKKHKIGNDDLIREAVGVNLSKDAVKNFVVVYNPTTDSIQVVTEANGVLVGDVFLFQGGTNVISGKNLQRFTFMFSPDQTESIGSAVITEKPTTDTEKAKISGKLQFTVPTSFGTGLDPQIGNTLDTTLTGLDVITNSDGTISVTDTNNISDSSNSNNNSSNNDSGNNSNNNSNNDSGNNNNTQVDTNEFVQAGAAGTANNPNVEVATGTFSAGKLFVAGQRENGNNNNGNNNDTNNTGETPGTGGTNNDGTISTNSTRDVQFVTRATQSGLTEIELAQIALQNSTNQAVIDFANQMIQDHTQMNQNLSELATQKGIVVPTSISSSQQTIVTRLENLQGQKFDTAFRGQAVSSHRQAIQLFQNEASNGDDSDLQSFAQNNIAELQQHLTEAQQLP